MAESTSHRTAAETYAYILAQLSKVREDSEHRAVACCPAHDDKNPSLSLKLQPDRVLVKCFAGCTAETVCRALGLTVADLFDRTGEIDLGRASRDPSSRIVTAEFQYEWRDAATGAAVVQTRTDHADNHKAVRWPPGTSKAPLLYHRHPAGPTLGDPPLIVCEGAKCADALVALGVEAVGLPDAESWRQPPPGAVLDTFNNRRVLVWPDHDAPGYRLAKRVTGHLRDVAGDVAMIAPPQVDGAPSPLPDGWDAADWRPPAGADALAVLQRAAVRPDAPADGTTDGAANLDVLIAEADPVKWIRAADIPPRFVPWLWRGRLVFGEIAIIGGEPGQGKSLIAVDIAARVSAGQPWPDGGAPPAPGAVAWIGHLGEDAPDYTIRPRLEAAGADLARVELVDARTDPDLESVCRSAAERRPALAVVDSYGAWTADTDANTAGAVRRRYKAVQPLRDAGACVLVVAHFNKDREQSGQARIAGSVQLTAAARCVFGVTDRVLSPLKVNLSRDPAALGFDVQSVTLTTCNMEIQTARAVWTGEVARPDDDPFASDPEFGTDGERLREWIAECDEPQTRNQVHERFEARSRNARERWIAIIAAAVKSGDLREREIVKRGRKWIAYEHSAASVERPSPDAPNGPSVASVEHPSPDAPSALGASVLPGTPPGGGRRVTDAPDGSETNPEPERAGDGCSTAPEATTMQHDDLPADARRRLDAQAKHPAFVRGAAVRRQAERDGPLPERIRLAVLSDDPAKRTAGWRRAILDHFSGGAAHQRLTLNERVEFMAHPWREPQTPVPLRETDRTGGQ